MHQLVVGMAFFDDWAFVWVMAISLALETVTSLLVKMAMHSLPHACPMENNGDWLVGILWHSVAAGDRRASGRLPLLVPLRVQLLAVETEMPLAVGCSSCGGVEAFARLMVHPVLATMVSWTSLSA